MAMLIVQTQAGTERVSTSANTLPTPWDISRALPNCYSAKFYPAKYKILFLMLKLSLVLRKLDKVHELSHAQDQIVQSAQAYLG
ncbi:hypothetical protein DPMN_060152 [Dreissena polymorpha]|uniref:Uncharacterized protein n=1 Tax=Dreissena polymorpha TaxID=45954 RepID=A0A9D4HHW3_DREPO|nr:hypothetical protein DPMN_060152 [Dreissena polymorpha]